MAQFYDQDNPRASYTNTSSRYDRGVSEGRYVNMSENLVRNSTGSNGQAQRERARVIKAQQRRQERQRRLVAFALACMITGGVAVGTISHVAETMHNNSVVYSQTSSFRRDVIGPNTHRTMNNEYYYYDYDDIADAIMADGKDFSTELYKAYANLGEYQTNRVMKYTDYSSVEDYVKANGYKDIKEWSKAERKKIVLNDEVSSKRAELDEMHKEINGDQIMDAVDNNFGGK